MALQIFIDGVDVTESVRNDSVQLNMQAFKGQVGAGEIAIDDELGTQSLAPAATEWYATESTATPTTIAGGFVAERQVRRGPLATESQRQFVPVLEDWNTALSDRVFKGTAAQRPKETDVERVLWMLGTGTMSMLAGNGRGHVPVENVTEMDKADYRGKTPLDLLDECAEAAGKNFYIYYKPGASGWQLYYDVVAAQEDLFTSDIKISGVATDVDNATVFGPSSVFYERDPERIASGILVEYDGGWEYVRDNQTKSQFRALQKTYIKKNIKTRAKARAWAEKALERFDSETQTLSCTVSVPGSVLGELRAGQRIRIKIPYLGITAYTFYRITGVNISRRAGRRTDYSDIEYDVRLTLKDRIRPNNKSNVRSPGDEPEETPNPGEYPLIKTWPDIPQPSISTSNFTGSVVVAGTITESQTHYASLARYGPTWSAGQTDYVRSHLQGYLPWTSKPYWTECGGLDNHFGGFIQREQWYKVTMPEPPANAAGISLSAEARQSGGTQGPGIGEILPLDVVVRDSQPTELRQGDYIGSVYRNTVASNLLISTASIPPAGSNLYIGYRTSWETTGRADPYAHACGWTWPFMSNSYNYDVDGAYYAGYSGRVAVSAPSALTWQTWGQSASNLGVVLQTSNTPWAGSNTILDAGSSGDFGSWYSASNSLYVGGTASAGKGIYMVGNEEDEDQPDGPWSGGAWSHTFTFQTSADGDTNGAGTRSIVSTTESGGVTLIGTVHLGDLERAEGISVRAPNETVYLAKAISNGEDWKARFESRNGEYFRGKIWRVLDGEPAHWDVQVALQSSGTTNDRWTLYAYAGQPTGHVVTIKGVTAAVAAASGSHIEKEWLGYATGDYQTFKTDHQFKRNSLRCYVNGIMVGPSSEDGENSSFTLDYWPTPDALMRASYIVR